MSFAASRALFLDRDGTLDHPRHYPTRPEELELFEGLSGPLRTLQAVGYKLVMVTNQSGLARGLFTRDDLARMHSYLSQQLADLGVHLDAIYHCPHHPDGTVEELTGSCDCRKPAPGMLLRAGRDLDLDLPRSWLVGDILDDVEAGHRARCRTVLVDLGTESDPEQELRRPHYVARDTRHALDLICAVEGLGAPVDLSYRPHSWSKTDGRPALTGGAL
ncbi:MAG: HAD family hydrolase [Chloroflexota bacterium]|nr:HAD family hydrolase [Chloroflexota bacterium]